MGNCRNLKDFERKISNNSCLMIGQCTFFCQSNHWYPCSTSQWNGVQAVLKPPELDLFEDYGKKRQRLMFDSVWSWFFPFELRESAGSIPGVNPLTCGGFEVKLVNFITIGVLNQPWHWAKPHQVGKKHQKQISMISPYQSIWNLENPNSNMISQHETLWNLARSPSSQLCLAEVDVRSAALSGQQFPYGPPKTWKPGGGLSKRNGGIEDFTIWEADSKQINQQCWWCDLSDF